MLSDRSFSASDPKADLVAFLLRIFSIWQEWIFFN